MKALPDTERMAEGIVSLWGALAREKGKVGAFPTAELTTTQALALRTVVGEGPLRMGSLATALGVTIATTSRTVDALAARGFVVRESDPADARAVRVTATARGKREFRLRRRRFVLALESLAADLSEHERRQLAESPETLARLFAYRGTSGGREPARRSA